MPTPLRTPQTSGHSSFRVSNLPLWSLKSPPSHGCRRRRTGPQTWWGQHTGQQFAHSEHKEQDDHLGQRDSADGCPSVEAKIMAVKPSSTALDISSEGSPVMPSVRVLYQPKPLQQNRATAEMESAHQLVEELAGPLFQMQAVADGEAHQDGQHHGRHAGCLDDGIDADGDGTEPEQGGQVIFQPAIKPVIDLSLSFVLPVCTFLHGPLQ